MRQKYHTLLLSIEIVFLKVTDKYLMLACLKDLPQYHWSWLVIASLFDPQEQIHCVIHTCFDKCFSKMHHFVGVVCSTLLFHYNCIIVQ
jgi:hypothetical protein